MKITNNMFEEKKKKRTPYTDKNGWDWDDKEFYKEQIVPKLKRRR